jgi:catechol 2,3-dioxygenase-like lactoylglutathione lyase family enzyme
MKPFDRAEERKMFAKLKHVAIVSDQFSLLGRFYQTVFGMKSSAPSTGEPRGAAVVGDGYIGLNINSRAPGRQSGLDHFGFEVEDVETVFARLKNKYPKIKVLQRPGGRSFAGISTHDPAGNVFDLSKGVGKRRGVYEEGEWQQPRYLNHLALRAVNPEILAEFYQEVFELLNLEKPAGDPNYYLSDGRVTFTIMPWDIENYSGSGIERPALDHLGFHVESVAAFQKDLSAASERDPSLAPRRARKEVEGEARQRLFSTCPYGGFHLADPDGVLIDVTDRPSV